jgi:tetratricopeptide (TPR) repeat protein
MVEVEKMKKDSNLYKKHENCGEIAYDAYMQALKLDAKVETPNMNIKNPREGLKYTSGILVNDAYKALAKKDTALMYQLAKKAENANDENPDAIYCLGEASELVGKKNDAKSYYLKLVKRGIKNRLPYIRLADLYRAEDDVPNAVKTMEAGVQFFLNDTVKEVKKPPRNEAREEKDKDPRDTFYVDYAEAYSFIIAWAGRSEEAKTIMEKALQKEPNNYTLLTTLGWKFNEERLYDDAEVYFKKAFDLQPDGLMSNYNIGNFYYNNYAYKYNAAQKLDDDQAYEAAMETANEILQKARPYLEKAQKLDTNDISILQMLSIVYSQSGEKEKLKAVEERINDVRGEAIPTKKGR